MIQFMRRAQEENKSKPFISQLCNYATAATNTSSFKNVSAMWEEGEGPKAFILKVLQPQVHLGFSLL